MTVLEGYRRICGIIDYEVLHLKFLYCMNSLFIGKSEMGDMLDALTIEKINHEAA